MPKTTEQTEKRRKQYRSYYWRNKEEISKKLKQKREQNPELVKQKNAENYKKNRERILQYKKKHRENNRGKLNHERREKRKLMPKCTRYMSRYGVNEEWYKLQMQIQKNKCAICGLESTNFKKRFAIDHCHATGKVRGLLCDLCNKGLGHFKDKASNLKAAIQYLRNHENKPDTIES